MGRLGDVIIIDLTIAMLTTDGIVLAFLVAFSAAGMADHFTRGGRHPPGDATNNWVVDIRGGKKEADSLAKKYGFKNCGKVSDKVLRRCSTTTRGYKQVPGCQGVVTSATRGCYKGCYKGKDKCHNGLLEVS